MNVLAVIGLVLKAKPKFPIVGISQWQVQGATRSLSHGTN